MAPPIVGGGAVSFVWAQSRRSSRGLFAIEQKATEHRVSAGEERGTSEQ